MVKKIGIVKDYNKNSGTIISLDGQYLFTNECLLENIQKNDLVIFRGEEIHNIKKAFFIKKPTKKDLETVSPEKIKKLINNLT